MRFSARTTPPRLSNGETSTMVDIISPRLDNPAKHQPRGWMRTSNLAGALSDTRALSEWEQRVMLTGFRERPDLYAELSVLTPDADGKLPKGELDKILVRAKTAGKGDAASIQGTAQHKVLETRLLTGELIGTPAMRAYQLALETLLREHHLVLKSELTERIVVNDEVKCAGRFDAALTDRLTGLLHIADLKTKQGAFWSLLEPRAQLAIYANATAMWDAKGASYVDMPAFDRAIGIVMHIPQGGPTWDAESASYTDMPELLNMDLAKGWRTALRAYEIVCDRSEARSTAALRDAVRPHPGLPTVERYARLLMTVDTPADGSALIAEITGRGMWCGELEQCARDRADQIRANMREIAS